MPAKTPHFWYPSEQTLSFAEWVLTPFSWLYGFGHKLHQNSKDAYKADAPVICLGNLVAGGSGKTPAAIALMDLIKEQNLANKPHFLTRGFGADEDKILQKTAPTIINADRASGAKQATQDGADMIVMDDGLQNPSLYKDIKFVVIDGTMGFGNQKLIPAGPLRTPLRQGLDNADAFVLIGEDKKNITELLPCDTPTFHAKFEALTEPSTAKSYVAFAGLGYPEKFFAFLKDDLGLDVVEAVSFADHHQYTESDLQKLQQKADVFGAKLITTEKDFVKLPSGSNVLELPVKLVWQDASALAEFLKNHLQS